VGLSKENRLRGLQVAGALFVFAGSCALAHVLLVSDDPIGQAAAESALDPEDYEVEIVVPAVRTNKRTEKKIGVAPKEGEDCTTGCSLAKHSVPEFTLGDFYEALKDYAAGSPSDQGDGLDKLLFYGKKTLEFIETEGTDPLSAEHVAFLKRELRRENAVVTIRMVDEHGTTRVQYGPEKVPLGAKQHLAPSEVGNLFAMEFNGTVMRTGLYHLWSRY